MYAKQIFGETKFLTYYKLRAATRCTLRMHPATGFATRTHCTHVDRGQVIEHGFSQDAATAVGGTKKQDIHAETYLG